MPTVQALGHLEFISEFGWYALFAMVFSRARPRATYLGAKS